MRGSETSENEKRNHQIPPLSVGQIVGELFAGMALGLVALAFVYVIGIIVFGSGGEYAVVGFLGMFFFVFPAVNGLSAVGVYLVGSRGEQTGSFLMTLFCGFVGGIVAVIASLQFLFNVEMILLSLPLLLIAPLVETIGFNMTRRYKSQT